DGEVIGVLTVLRTEVKAFTDKQLALLQSFADQAVIAIENARLLDELRETLDRQTATSEILRAIASPPGDSNRSLGTIAGRAARMFAATSVAFRRFDNGVLRAIAMAGPQSRATVEEIPTMPVDGPLHASVSYRENRQIAVDDDRSAVAEELAARLHLPVGSAA